MVTAAGQLGHPPQLADGQPESGEELQHLDRGRRGTYNRPLALIEPEGGADLRTRLVRKRGGIRDPLRLQARLDLLPDSWHRAPGRRLHLGKVLDDRPRVGDRGHLEALADRALVVRRPTVGDVRGGQERGDAAAGRGRQAVGNAPDLRHQVRVGQLDALRRARRPRGVDQRQQVGGLDRAPGGLEVELAGRELEEVREADRLIGAIAVHDDDLLDGAVALGAREEAREQGALGDRNAAARVRQHVLDLLRGRGVVDRERGCAEVQGGGVDQVELGAVGEHQRDGVAAPDAERGEAAGKPLDARGVLAEGDRDAVSGRPQSDLVRALGGGQLERLAQRGGTQRRRLGRRRLALDHAHLGTPRQPTAAVGRSPDARAPRRAQNRRR